MPYPGFRPVALDLTPEEAIEVFDAIKRQRVRHTARAGYWSTRDGSKADGFKSIATMLSNVNRRLQTVIRSAK